jgi:probable F420-dependent oxidoreductase
MSWGNGPISNLPFRDNAEHNGERYMKVGIDTLLTEHSIDVAVLAKRADDLGFESVWVPEQNILPVATEKPVPRLWADIVDPYIALARASAATKNIKLGTAVSVVVERNPLNLAKQVSTLDMYSAGRFLFGIGVGSVPEQAELYGTDYPRRWTQAKELVAAMKALWTQEESEFHGNRYGFPPVYSFPTPARRPHPPMILGGSAPRVLPHVVDWADGWIPIDVTPEQVKEARETLDRLAEAAGRDPASIEISVVGLVADRDTLAEYEECGADRVSVSVAHADEADSLAQLEEIAEAAEPWL